jgi:anti-sigma28 factor (negative regulator of flagellin synthesis)
MSDIALPGVAQADRVNPMAAPCRTARHADTATGSPARGIDQVDISDHAKFLSRLKEGPVRSDLVARVRQEIADGTYDTPERLDKALDGLLSDVTAAD